MGAVPVSVDTYSGMIYTFAHSGETSTHVISHFWQAFSYMGLPKHVKADNGLAYVSHGFVRFLSDWNISHSTGIPCNSQGQAIIEHTHCTLKNMLFKQKGGKKYGILMTSKEKLAQALFTLNFLDLRLDHTKPAATLHFQNTILSENYTPGQMIADNTPVWWENAMNNWCKGLKLRKGYALVISDDGQHH